MCLVELHKHKSFDFHEWKCAVLEYIRVCNNWQQRKIYNSFGHQLSRFWLKRADWLFKRQKFVRVQMREVFVLVLLLLWRLFFSTPRISNCFTLTPERNMCVWSLFSLFKLYILKKKIEEKNGYKSNFSHIFTNEHTHIECLLKWDRKKKQQRQRQQENKWIE